MTRLRAVLVVGAMLAAIAAAVASAMQLSPWSTAQKLDEISGNHPDVNTTSLDGCPIQSPDGLSLYQASNRLGSTGLDIWVARRTDREAPLGAPERLPEPVNSASDDFCPTPVRGGGLYFVSRRTIDGVTCGLGDIYFTRFNPRHGWSEPRHLGCAPTGPNTALDEQGPSVVELDGIEQLYFSSSRAAAQGGLVAGDIFVSARAGGSFGPGVAVAALNDAAANDIQPNVRKDGRELVFSSNRTGSAGQDIWVSTRGSTDAPWAAPTNLGPAVNTEAGESRPSLSWDATELLFGRAPGPEGQSDIYLATRRKSEGSGT